MTNAVNVAALGSGPAFSARNTSNQSLTGGATTKIVFDIEQWDTNNNFASSRFTPTVAGYYQLICHLAYTNSVSVSGYASTYFYKNGSLFAEGNEIVINNTTYWGLPASCMVYLNGTTDYVEIYASTNGNSVVYADASNLYSYFQGALVRAA